MSDSMHREIAEARLGRTLCGRYTLDTVLGVGGMAVVYRATHRNGHRCAVKMLHPHLATYESVRERFLKEAYTANRVGHPGAVAVTDDDVAEDGAGFLVMELLEGETLEAWSERHRGGQPSAEDVSRIVHDLLDILIAAHRQGIVHRDLKPENLFRTKDGRLKVLDFGIARALYDVAATSTQTGSVLGTPAFMAPEQAAGKIREIDARTDLWAVGATAFALLSGRVVHDKETSALVHAAAVMEPAPPIVSVVPDLPAPLAAVFDRALAFDKEARWDSSRAMQVALEGAFLASFGHPLVSREHLELQETLIPETARGEVVPSVRVVATVPLPPPPPQAGGTTAAVVTTVRGGGILSPPTAEPESSFPAPPSTAPPSTAPRRRPALGVALGVGLGAVIAGTAWFALRPASSASAPHESAAAALIPSAAAPIPVPSASSASSGSPSITADAALAPSTSRGATPAPAKPPPATRPRPSSTAAPARTATPNCDPPFVIRDGIEIPKPECK